MAHSTRYPAVRERRHPLVAISLLLVGLLLPGLQGCARQSEPQDEHLFQHAHVDADPHAAVISREEADHFWVFAESKDTLGSGGEFHVYIDPEQYPDARASLAEYGVGVGGALPVHRHDKTEEIAYFLSGEGVVQIYENDTPREVPVRTGHVWYTPPGAWHGLRNTGAEPLTLVFATIPNEEKGLLSFFRRIGTRPGVEGTPLSPEEFGRIAAEHDLILKPPTTVE